jgi:hypothetical protein
MSSDLPETHRSATSMARCLTSYMDCPYAVQARIREDFANPPSIGTLKLMRSQFLAGKRGRHRQIEAYKPHEGYHPSDASEAAAIANDRFLRALRAERAASEQRALRSTFLTQPELVAARFDMEAEAAWRQNRELAK